MVSGTSGGPVVNELGHVIGIHGLSMSLEDIKSMKHELASFECGVLEENGFRLTIKHWPDYTLEFFYDNGELIGGMNSIFNGITASYFIPIRTFLKYYEQFKKNENLFSKTTKKDTI
jgi:hypothetical protein